MTAKELIDKFQLEKHPEGGFYKRTYCSNFKISKDLLPNHGNDRFSQSAIYYLLEGNDISKFHKLKSDEIWFFHEGSSFIIYILQENKIKELQLGRDIQKGEEFQILIPANTWFAAELKDKTSFGFVSCTVSPAFDFDDFELSNKSELSNIYPKISKFENKFFEVL